MSFYVDSFTRNVSDERPLVKVLVLDHAKVVDVNDKGAILENYMIVLEGGQVSYVGKSGSVPAPKGCDYIDCKGRTVIPGLIEGHAHVSGLPDTITVLRKSLQRGITTVASVGANIEGIEARNDIEAGKVRGCASIIAGCVVSPTFGHVRYRTADGPWEVRKAVREMVMAGADFIKTAASGGFWAKDEKCSVRNYTFEELEALSDESHAWGRPCVVHAHTQPGVNNSIAAGIDQIHHGCFIDEEGIRGIKEKDLWFMPTLRVTTDRNINLWTDRPWQMEEMRKSQRNHREMVKLAHEIGVKIAFGTDYPGSVRGWQQSPYKTGDASMVEIQELQSCGMSPLECLISATRVTAEAYRKYDEFGSIDVGKKADLVVAFEDPTVDVKNLYDYKNIAVVIKAGRVEYAAGEYTKFYAISDFE